MDMVMSIASAGLAMHTSAYDDGREYGTDGQGAGFGRGAGGGRAGDDGTIVPQLPCIGCIRIGNRIVNRKKIFIE